MRWSNAGRRLVKRGDHFPASGAAKAWALNAGGDLDDAAWVVPDSQRLWPRLGIWYVR
jgi:hypothetical protein